MTELNNENTALVVVDMQNDFAHPKGALFAPPSGEAIEPVLELVKQAGNADVPVVYTRDTHSEEQFDGNHYYDEFERWGEHVIENEWGNQIVDELEVDKNADFVVDKGTYNAFHNTDLSEWLEDNEIENVVICGTLANVCVMHTASGAALRDYRPVVVEDALGFIEESDKEYAVEHIEWLFGETTTMDDLKFN